jgi:FkbM family methyltransferase
VHLAAEKIFNINYATPVREPFWLQPGVSIYIYGTGSVGQHIYHVLTSKGITIAAYMEHRMRENPCLGEVPIFAPDSASIQQKAQAVVILAIHNREVDMLALITRLKVLGYTQFISMIDLYDHFAADLGTRYWLTNRSLYRGCEAIIGKANALWADAISRETYAKILQFRISGDFSLLPAPDMDHQYFPPDLPRWHQPVRMIDCGAYDGDVICAFIQNDYEFSALAAFEPDLQNYARLVAFIHTQGQAIAEISLWPCGVYAQSSQLHFASGMGESSIIAASGETLIQCVALDDALPNFAPTLIKMDIEGAEMDALSGARQLIRAYRPALAISVYHTPTHLWEIPLWVAQFSAENGLNYTYHLRAHAHNCFETVFYAIPA